MRKSVFRAAAASALAAPLLVAGMGFASAAPAVTPSGTAGAPYEGTAQAPAGESWTCVVTAPNFTFTTVTSTAAPFTANAAGPVTGHCFGMPGFYAPLSGSVD